MCDHITEIVFCNIEDCKNNITNPYDIYSTICNLKQVEIVKDKNGKPICSDYKIKD